MVVSTNQPPNMVLHQNLSNQLGKQLGITVDGHEWAMRALHPCDDNQIPLVGIPDEASTKSNVFEIRHSYTVAAPNATDTWDCQILELPTIDVPAVFRTKKASDPPVSASWTQWQLFSNVGNQFNPGRLAIVEATTGPVVNLTPQLCNDSDQFRSTFRGLTIIHDAPALENQGMVTSGQWGNGGSLLGRDFKFTGGGGSDDIQVPTLQFDDIPLSQDDIIVKCPGATQWQAREGVYLPVRFNDSVHKYQDPGGDIFPNPSNQLVKSGLVISTTDTDPTHVLQPQILHDTDNLSVTTAGQCNMLMAMSNFTGLSPKAQLVVKIRSGIEFVATATSNLAPAARNVPNKDQVALDVVHNIAKNIPQAYYHKFNSLGLMLPTIFGAAKAALGLAAPWLLGKIRGFIDNVGNAAHVA